jgi:alcohol dehydrogenase
VKAVLVTGPGQVTVASVPDPVIADPGDAIVRVRRAAVCGTDLHVTGAAVDRFIPGHEFAGEVTEAGPAVTSVGPGDLVAGADYTACGTCWWCRRGDHWHCAQRRFFGTGAAFGPALEGAQAELVRVPHADVVLRPVPAGISLDAAAFLGDTLATGYAAVQRAAFRPGDTLAVLGGGPVGQLMSLVAQACSAGAVLVVEPVAARRELAAASGALTAEPEAARALVNQLTDGRGADAVLDAVGGELGLDSALGLVRSGGTVVSAGLHPETTWSLPAERAFARELTVRFAIGDFMRDAGPLLALLRSGVVDPLPVVSERIGLDDVPGAYQRMRERTTLKPLIVL